MSDSSQEAVAAEAADPVAVSTTEIEEENEASTMAEEKRDDRRVTLTSDSIESSRVDAGATEKTRVDEGVAADQESAKQPSTQPPSSPSAPIVDPDRNKIGECNLLPVLVEQLRTALEHSCSRTRRLEEGQESGARIPPSAPSPPQPPPPPTLPLSSRNGSEDELRAWASGLHGNPAFDKWPKAESPRGLKLDLKFLEDLLVSDIQTALDRLRETLGRLDIGTLARHSSSLDPTNKLNLLKLISSLLANLKIPEEGTSSQQQQQQQQQQSPPPQSPLSTLQSNGTRRRRSERHTIGVSAEELARARQWLEGRRSIAADLPDRPVPQSQTDKPESLRVTEENNCRIRTDPEPMANNSGGGSGSGGIVENHFEEVREKYMKDAINQQQSLQSKHKESWQRESRNSEVVPPRAVNVSTSHGNGDDRDDPDEYDGLPASSDHHRSSNNVQTKSNKFLAKKSKIKRANTIDIPNYLKLQAESLANGRGGAAGCVSLRRPINIGDRYAAATTTTTGFNTGGSVIPSFEPKTENDRKFLALINKNIEASPPLATTDSGVGQNLLGSPFKSFNYHRVAASAGANAPENNWNNRFSNIKTAFDKPRAANRIVNEEGGDWQDSREFNGNWRKEPNAFSHAPTSPFHKIGAGGPIGIGPKPGSSLRAKVKMFDQENGIESSLVHPSNAKTSTRRTFEKKNSLVEGAGTLRASAAGGRTTENGNILNYRSFCKELAAIPRKNQAINGSSRGSAGPWSTDKTGGPKPSIEFRAGPIKFGTFNERDRDTAIKVPVAYQPVVVARSETSDRKKNISQHRRLYENYETLGNSREILAYPIEVNYQEKRPTKMLEKRFVEGPRRSIFGVQSVAVQTADPTAGFASGAAAGPNLAGQGRDDRVPRNEIKVTGETATATANANYSRLSDDCESSGGGGGGGCSYRSALERKPVGQSSQDSLNLQTEMQNRELGDCRENDDGYEDNNENYECVHASYRPEGFLDAEKQHAPIVSAAYGASGRENAEDFSDEDKIANQDISATEGVVTRYACAIGTVSPTGHSPLPIATSHDESAVVMDPIIRRHNQLQQNLIKQLRAEESVAPMRRLSSRDAFLSSGEEDDSSRTSGHSQFLNSGERVSSVEPAAHQLRKLVCGNEPIVEGNNTQEKIDIFERRRRRRGSGCERVRPQPQESSNLAVESASGIPRAENFVTPKINVVSPSYKVSTSAIPSLSGVDSSDEYLMSCASRPSRNIVLSKSESWHQLAMSKGNCGALLRVPERQDAAAALLKPPKPKSPSSLRLSKQYEASTSSDSIKKMEDKIQRYFKSPASSESPRRRDTPKSKRDFGAHARLQGTLMRSHTMPHIYDEDAAAAAATTDVEKAFDSLFKEATRSERVTETRSTDQFYSA